jgi:hypothetical protein
VTIYVLSQRDGKSVANVAAVSSEVAAREWYSRAPGNDYTPLELDALAHLGLPDGPEKTQNLLLPALPVVKDHQSLAAYLCDLADSMEASATILSRQIR